VKVHLFFYTEISAVEDDDEAVVELLKTKSVLDAEIFIYPGKVERFIKECFDLETNGTSSLIKCMIVPFSEADFKILCENYTFYNKYRGNFFFYNNEIVLT
jgi:hypothetical protein